MAKLLKAPNKNAIQKTLASQLLSTATTGDPISFDDVDGIDNAPGVLVINRVDSNGVATASNREYIEYSGTSGNTVIIETRNVDSSNAALTHAVGSIVEFVPDVSWANRMYTALSTLVDPDDIAVINPSVVINPLSSTSVINSSGATISAILDEDDLSSDRADAVPTQQSVKAYQDSTIQIASDGATVTFDLGNGAYRKHKVTITDNRTLALSNVQVGQVFIIDIIQDGSGSHTVTWFPTIKWVDGTEPTLTTDANAIDTFGFICTSTDNYQGYVIGQNVS